MSSLSDLLPAGGGGKNVNFVASGVLPNGQAVALKANGQVEAVEISPAGAGTPVVFATSDTAGTASVFDTVANKVVVFYTDTGNSSYGTAIVGTLSGSTISFGSAVVFNSGEATQLSATFDSNSNKAIVAYRDGVASNHGKAIVGTVSGTSISFGAEASFNAGSTTNIGIGFDSTANKAVIAFRDDGNSDYGTAVVGTVSGTSISFGSEAVFQTNQTSLHSVVYDSVANKTVILYRHDGGSNYGKATVCTVSGTSISFGTAVTFKSAYTEGVSGAFDTSANKVVIPYTISGAGKAVVGTVSGTSISFGSEATFSSTGSGNVSCVFDSSANKTVVGYTEAVSTFDGFTVSGTVSGTSISFDTAVNFTGAATYSGTSTVYDSTANKIVFSYKNASNSSYGTSVVYAVASSSNNTSFLGITDAAVASGASGSVTIKGGLKTGLAGGTFAVTVANPGAGNRYYINGVLQQTLNLREGFTYKFDQSASSNSGHPFRFSITSNGTHAGGSEYTTGVTTSGTPGNAGAYTQIVVAASAPTLYYYCTNHSLMGGQANTIAAIVANSIYYVQTDGSISTVSTSPAVRIGRAFSPTSINLEFS